MMINWFEKRWIDGHNAGEAMTWAATGEVSKGPKAVVIKDGVYVAM